MPRKAISPLLKVNVVSDGFDDSYAIGVERGTSINHVAEVTFYDYDSAAEAVKKMVTSMRKLEKFLRIKAEDAAIEVTH